MKDNYVCQNQNDNSASNFIQIYVYFLSSFLPKYHSGDTF